MSTYQAKVKIGHINTTNVCLVGMVTDDDGVQKAGIPINDLYAFVQIGKESSYGWNVGVISVRKRKFLRIIRIYQYVWKRTAVL